MAARKVKPPDPKVQALRQRGCLNPRPDSVTDPLFAETDFCDARDLVQVKYEMLRRARVDGQPITAAAAAFGFSRPSFYQAQSAFEQEGLAGLIPKKPGPRHAHKLGDEVMQFVLEALAQDASVTAPELAQRLQARFELTVHPRSIERAVVRHQAQPKKKRR